jgi:hypothetical protein
MNVRCATRLLLFAALTACGMRNPVKNTIVIEPEEDRRHAMVTLRTEIAANGNDPAKNERLSEMRAAIIDRRDPWTPRFAAINADSERVVYEKSRGVLRRAERSARIGLDDLQRFLSDCGTVQISESEHWTELAFYPSSSTRATRQQREHVEKSSRVWAADAVRYLRALDRLYSYLDREPQRANAVFTILLSDKDEKSVIDKEDALLTAVNDAMSAIVDHVDQAREQGFTLDEEFDLVFNPLPGEIVVRLPAPIVLSEGFERRDERTVAIPRRGLVDAISGLEGRWASPDPLAIIARASDTDAAKPAAEDVAARARRSSATVTVDEVEKALAERLRPAAAYRVRW